MPEDEEWDEHDPRSRHVIAAAADGTPIGTGRLLPDGHIGRMAVLEGVARPRRRQRLDELVCCNSPAKRGTRW